MRKTPISTAGPESDRDPKTGRFARGNQLSVITGSRSRQFWIAAESQRREMRMALLRQRGYDREVDAPPALVAVADGCAQALLVRDGSFNRLIEQGGPTTLRGRHRAVLTTWQMASDRALKHLQAIGLQRVEHDVYDCSPEEWVRRQEASEDATPVTPDDERIGDGNE